MNQSRFQVKLEEAYKELTPKAVEFLECRRTVDKDILALNITQFSRTSVSRWKQKDAFNQAYWLVTKVEPQLKAQQKIDAAQSLETKDVESEDVIQEAAVTSPADEVLFVDPSEIHAIARRELARLSSTRLPELFERLWTIVEKGKDADALRAITTIFSLGDINPQTMNPEEMDEVKRKVLEWTKLKINKSPSLEEVREEIGELND